MWTFGCINCRNVIPYLIDWHDKYSSEGLVIIGNHFPEFDHESVLSNLEQAVKDLKIPYAVAEDNLGETWKAYEHPLLAQLIFDRQAWTHPLHAYW